MTRLPPWLGTLLIGLVLATGGALLAWLLQPVLAPGLASVMLYVLLLPLVEALERAGLARTPAILLTLGGVTLAGAWALSSVLPGLTEQLVHFAQRLPETGERLAEMTARIDAALQRHLGMALPEARLGQWFHEALDGLAQALLDHGPDLLGGLLLWLFLVPFLTFFLLRDFQRLRNGLLGRVPNAAFEDVLRIYHRVASRLERYVRGVVLQSSIVATVVGVGLALVGLPMAPLLGLLAGLLNLIPYLGPLLGAVPPLLVALSTGMDPTQLSGILLTLALAQLVDNLLVVPWLLARAVDLHPLAALLGVLVAGQAFGALGMILALPLLASARICLEGIHEGLARRHAQVGAGRADMAGTS